MTTISMVRSLGQSRLAWLVFIVGMVLTLLAWRTTALWEEEQARQEFNIHVNDALDAVQQRLDGYIYTLYGTRGLFVASDDVTREEFRRYVAETGLGRHHPGVHSFAFIRHVPADKKPDFERRLRRELGDSGEAGAATIKPPGLRADYFPIEYIEPENRYGHLLGVDRGAQQDTRQTLERARDSGKPAASGRLRSNADNLDTANFFLLVLPVYRNGSLPASLPERRAALIGFVAARIEIDTLLNNVIGAGILNELFFELYDGGGATGDQAPMTPEHLLHATDDSGALHAASPVAKPRFTLQTAKEVAGRRWQFFFGSRAAHPGGAYLPLLVLLGGIVTSLLLFWLVRMLVMQRQKVISEVARQKSLFSQVMDALPANIFLKDQDFRFVLINEETAGVLGTSKEAVVGKTDFDVFPHEVATTLRADDMAVFAEERLLMREERLVSNGTERYMLSGKKVIYLPGSNEPMLLGFSLDISERKKVELELERQQQFIRQVIDAVPAIISVSDRDGKSILVNQAGAAYWGKTPEQVVGHSLAKVFPLREDFDRILGMDRMVIDHLRNIELEESLTLPDGELLWLSTSKRPLLQPDGKVNVLVIATDITARKCTELALRESEERLRAILDNTTSVIFLKDLEGRYLLINSEYEKLQDVLREQVIGKTDYDLYPLELADTLRANDRLALLEGHPLEFEEKVFGANGERTYLAVKFVLRDAAGEPYAVAGISTDITDRLRLEQEAARGRANALSRALTDAVSEGLIGVDAAHRVVFANPKAQELLGIAESAMLDRQLDDVVQARTTTGEALTDDICPAWSLIAAGQGFQTDDWSFRRGDGSRFPVSLAIAPLDRQPDAGSVLSFQDITLRKQMEERLALAVSQQKAFLNNLPEMAWLKDTESRFVLTNEPFSIACGYSSKDLVGKTDLDIWPRELAEAYRADDRRVMASGERKRVVEPLEGKDGIRCWIETIKSPIWDGDGRIIGTVGTARDVTERKQAEEEARRHMTELARVNAELDEFTYVASHDLQEPVRKLVAFSDLLRKDMGGDLPPRAAQDLTFITDAARRMQKLVKDLLVLSRAGKVSMVHESLALDDAVDQALETLELRIVESGAIIRRVPLPMVWGDPTLLAQLYQNLIGNALKFVYDRCPEITLTAEQVDGTWVFGVRDNGIGIDRQYAEQIFMPFKRLHGQGKFEGSGVGLSICRKVVERHHGHIWIESAENQGAWFRFTLGNPPVPPTGIETGKRNGA